MKYQITCDNCGTQFLIESKEGQTIECACPHCKGVMEITLPIVSGAKQFGEQQVRTIGDNIGQATTKQPDAFPDGNAPQKGDSRERVMLALLSFLIGLVLVVGAYFFLFRSAPEAEVETYQVDVENTANDSVSEAEPMEEESNAEDASTLNPVDTAVVPQTVEEKAPLEPEAVEERAPEDTTHRHAAPSAPSVVEIGNDVPME